MMMGKKLCLSRSKIQLAVVGFLVCLQLSNATILVADEPNGVASESAVQRQRRGEPNVLLEQPIQEYFLPLQLLNGESERLSPFRTTTHLSTEFGLMGTESGKIVCAGGQVNIDLSDSDVGAWAGVWHSLVAHGQPDDSALDLSRCFGGLVAQRLQPRCVGVRLRAKGSGSVKVEIKSLDQEILWQRVEPLESEDEFQTMEWPLDANSLPASRVVNWVVEQPTNISVDSLSLLLQFPKISFEERVFLISYAKLARCYSPENGVVKDKAHLATGEFDCVPTSGMFCLASCAAWRLGMMERERAVEVLHNVYRTISALERGHGLLPHFIRKSDGKYRIAHGTEYSSIDTSLYYHSMAIAAQMLHDNQLLAELTEDIRSIDFAYLVDDEGYVTHGLADDGETKLESRWQDFGGETVLVAALYRMAVGDDAALRMDGSGRVFRGRGFIAELQSLFYPQFSAETKDMVSGVNWLTMRTRLLRRSTSVWSILLAGDCGSEDRHVWSLRW